MNTCLVVSHCITNWISFKLLNQSQKKKTQEGPLVAGCSISHWSLVSRWDWSEIGNALVPFTFTRNERHLTSQTHTFFIPPLWKQSARWAVVTIAPNYFEKFRVYCRLCGSAYGNGSGGKASHGRTAGRLFGDKQIKAGYFQRSPCTEHKVNCR